MGTGRRSRREGRCGEGGSPCRPPEACPKTRRRAGPERVRTGQRGRRERRVRWISSYYYYYCYYHSIFIYLFYLYIYIFFTLFFYSNTCTFPHILTSCTASLLCQVRLSGSSWRLIALLEVSLMFVIESIKGINHSIFTSIVSSLLLQQLQPLLFN